MIDQTGVPRITPEECERYRRDGVLIRRGVFSADEVAVLRDECERLTRRPDLMTRANMRARVRDHAPHGRIIDRLDPVFDLSEVFDRVGTDTRIVGPAEDLAGVPMQRFKDKLVLKSPGTNGYTVHQDYAYWQQLRVDPEKALSAAVAIDDATEENGALQVFVGQHHRLLTTPGEATDPSEDQVDLNSVELVELRAGDVFFLHGLVPHRSGVNRADAPRRMLFVTLAATEYGQLTDAYMPFYHARQRASFTPDELRDAHFA